jgi:electron transfer flavoprotein alpha subunit
LAQQYGIYILAEVTDDGHPTPLTLELMGLGGGLADKLNHELCAVLLGHGIGAAAEELSKRGGAEVFVLDNEGLARYNPDTYLPILEKLFTEKAPKAVLMGHTCMGQDIAPRPPRRPIRKRSWPR